MVFLIKKTNQLINNKAVQLIFGVTISLVSLLYAFQNINVYETINVLRKAGPFWLLLSVASVFFGIFCKAFRWKKMLHAFSISIKVSHLGLILFASHALNTIYPIRVGELYRIYMASYKDKKVSIIQSLAVIFLEKFLDLSILIILLLCIMIFFPYPEWVGKNDIVISVIVCIILICIFWIGLRNRIFQKLCEWFFSKFQGNLRVSMIGYIKSLDSFSTNRKNYLMLINIIFWSFIIWFIAAITNYLTFMAVKISLPFFVAIILLVILQLGISIPSLPGKIGIFEAICVIVLKSYNISHNEALGFAILLHIIVYLPAMLIGLVVLLYFGISNHSNQLTKDFHLVVKNEINEIDK